MDNLIKIEKGVKIDHKYIKSPYPKRKCKLVISSKRDGYKYLDGSCYLSGSFELDCPSV